MDATHNPYVANLLAKFGIKTSVRSCFCSTLWNGQDLALYTSMETEDGEEKIIPLKPFDIMHEIAHWVVADPVEREFPEFGLPTPYINGASGRDWSILTPREWEIALKETHGVLTHEEAEFREYCADFLGCFWFVDSGEAIPDDYWPHIKYSNKELLEKSGFWLISKGLVPQHEFEQALTRAKGLLT